MRVWVDISNSPQVLFFRPLVVLLQERGHEVEVTTRDYAQTLELLELHAISHNVVGPRHGGATALGKGRAFTGRLRALRGWARPRRFDIALSHASHELPLVARSLGIPSSYAFDYEFARTQHTLGSKAARRVVVPEAIPQDRLDRLGASASKVRRFPGLKEEYYLAGFSPDESVVDVLGIDRDTMLAVVRTPPEVSLYHRHGNPLFADLLRVLGADSGVRTVVLPRTQAQRSDVAALGLSTVLVPEHAIDAQSLVALADVVISAGGTMNREAAALGIPVYTTFAGRLGAVDEQLILDGRLELLTSPDAVRLEKRSGSTRTVERDPALLLDLLLTALEA